MTRSAWNRLSRLRAGGCVVSGVTRAGRKLAGGTTAGGGREE